MNLIINSELSNDVLRLEVVKTKHGSYSYFSVVFVLAMCSR